MTIAGALARTTLDKIGRPFMAARISSDILDDQLEPGLRRFAQALGFEPGHVARAVETSLQRARTLQGAGSITREEGRQVAYGVIARAFLTHAAALHAPSLHTAARRQAPASPKGARLAAVTGDPAASSEADRLRAALSSLPPLERAALLLVVLEGLSYSQAASALGIGRVECAQLLAAARSGLALRLEPARARPAVFGRPHLRVVK